nr:unnamed protein product [Digitaria exilis]
MPRKALLPIRGPTTPPPLGLLLRRLLPRRRAPSSPPPARRRTAAMAPRAGDPAAAAAAVASFRVGMVRVVSFLVGGINLAVLLLGLYLINAVLPSGCAGGLAFAAAPALAGVRVLAMIGAARAQHATADAIARRHLHEDDASVAADAVARHEIRELLLTYEIATFILPNRTVLDEDEVYSVARLLGDLVAYRASGTGHLELLAGLALLQKHGRLPELQNDLVEAPHDLMQEAASLHPFAEACYTGPLLDFGRNPILFPCAWVYRQGVLTPWARRRRPALDGDNWWRGHAAAFLRFVNIPPKALLRGRVCQSRREAAYFVVVLHDKQTLVIGVRGTETPEDLITDGLCRECAFTMEDLDGLIKYPLNSVSYVLTYSLFFSEKLPATTREKVISTFPHYGHGGIVESARELFMQLNECTGENTSSGRLGFLSTVLGEGSECHGYKVRLVGHSLGGAVATVLGMMLFGKYPDVHVYAYGPLPCVDFVIAEACSDFVTTIICNDEFSSRLSINSILRLRSAAISALSDNSPADTAMIQKLARRILHVNRYHDNGTHGPGDDTIEGCSDTTGTAGMPVPNEREISHQDPLCNTEPELRNIQNGFAGYSGSNASIDEHLSYEGLNNGHDVQIIPIDEPGSGFKEHPTSCREIPVEPPEMFLPGLIVHIVRQKRSLFPLWQCWSIQETEPPYKAVLAKRENFRDIVVTPSMFTDHLPWR